MISPLDTRIAFFGGSGSIAAVEMLARLRGAGYSVVAGTHDPRDAPLLRAAGIPYVADKVEAVNGCQVVITSLQNPSAVEEAYLGEHGLLEMVDSGTLLIDVSTSTPQLAREIHAMASISDIYTVDAPIVNLGEKEQAVAYVGGDAQAREMASPLFPYLAPAVYPQEDAGEGQFAAMVSYIALAGSLMGAIEAMSLARIAGFSDRAALGALASSAGGSRALIDYMPRVLAQDFNGRIKVAEFLDALEVALDAADNLDITLPMVETAFQLYDLLGVVGGDDLNIHALALLYEDEKTCARFGLDWALADAAQAEYDENFDVEEFLRQNFGGAMPEGGMPGGGMRRPSSPGPDSESGPEDGSSGPSQGGYPFIGGIFSRN